MIGESTGDNLFQPQFIVNLMVRSNKKTAVKQVAETSEAEHEEEPKAALVEEPKPAYMDSNGKPKQKMSDFLKLCISYEIYHKETQKIVKAPQIVRASFHRYPIRDDRGQPIPFIDPRSTRNNCLFAALQAATGIALNIDNIRQVLRSTLGTEKLSGKAGW